MKRWTIKELENISTLRFIRVILTERKDGLSQPYSPLGQKLGEAIARVDELIADEEALRSASATSPGECKTYEDVANLLDWKYIRCSDGTIELETSSPAGEDIVIDIDGEDIPKEVREYADSFSVDDHVAMWANSRGEGGVPETFAELLEDARAIQEMLDKLASALEDFEDAKN